MKASRIAERWRLALKIALGYQLRRTWDNPRIDHEHRLVFVHIPKTAGNSVTQSMASVRGPAAERSPRIAKHAKAVEVRGLIGAARWEQYFSFAFVRNPWDLMVSSYHWWLQKAPGIRYHRRLARKVAGMDGFEEFIRSPVGRGRINERPGELCDWFEDWQGTQLVRFVGRVERIEEDWRLICEQCGVSLPPIPHVNRSRHDDYRSYYTPQTRELVARRFARSIEQFGYSF